MTPPPLSHLLAEGRSLLAEATLGEWKATPPSGPWPADYWAVGTTADGLLERFTGEGPRDAVDDGADARAIAWAMTNLSHLLDALDRVNTLLRRWDSEKYDDLFGAVQTECVREVRKALEGDHTA
ncbi:hypothetical protein [Nocardia ignorata]|uniref:Uncharacterized protein n=1 Tax=Nocardia ignorata TaxID=145285 RepID=A0A4R6NZ35_NOCIG|nr:hypothetical protein [Nocardia ignorata]TDP29889.1 hypothetical protein DFR75_112158 [Nocardia ignorata]